MQLLVLTVAILQTCKVRTGLIRNRYLTVRSKTEILQYTIRKQGFLPTGCLVGGTVAVGQTVCSSFHSVVFILSIVPIQHSRDFSTKQSPVEFRYMSPEVFHVLQSTTNNKEAYEIFYRNQKLNQHLLKHIR